MKLTDFFLDQLKQEAIGTRLALERVPDGLTDWKPHEKSMPLGYLSSLVATMPAWIDLMVNHDEFDVLSPAGSGFKPQVWTTATELIRVLDESETKARTALENTTDEHLMTPWKFVAGGQTVNEQPRYRMIRDFVFTHLAHHRGQLTVYLRLNDARVPAIYGPSADERGF